MTNKIFIALENVLNDVDRLEHLQLHFSDNTKHLRGSTFNKEFVKNPFELILYISEQVSRRNFKLKINGNELVLIIHVQGKVVGFDALASLSDLNEDELQRIVWKKRFDFNVQSLEKEAQETTEIRAIFRQNKTLELKSIFPGIYAPPFPEESSQSKEEYQQANEFWDAHVLLY